jgi:hypothetical protein
MWAAVGRGAEFDAAMTALYQMISVAHKWPSGKTQQNCRKPTEPHLTYVRQTIIVSWIGE